MSSDGPITDWDMDAANEAGKASLAWAAEKITGNMRDAKAVMIYGIVAFCISAVSLAVYIPLDHTNTMQGLRWGIW